MLNKVGKIGLINATANRELKSLFESKGIIRCEKCGSTWGLTFAHRHKRWWYRSRPELLSDFSQVLLLCLKCHQDIECNKELSEELFIIKRGKESLDY